MGIAERVGRLLLRDALPPEQPIHLIAFGTAAGLTPFGLNEQSSLGLSAVWRCVSLLAGALASLDWQEWRGTLQLPPSRLVAAPSATLTRREWTWKVTASLALYDAAYLWRVGGTDVEGVPWSLLPIPPPAISPAGSPPDQWGMIAPDAYRVGQAVQLVPADEILVVRRATWPTVPDHLAGLLRLARTNLGASLAAEGYSSRYWQAGGAPTTVITTEAELIDEQANALAERWRSRRAQGPDYPAVLGKGAKANPYGADPTQQAAVEARRELIADVGRFFGIPTYLLNAPAGDPMTYRSTESEGLAFVRYTLADYIGALQDAITGELPGGRVMRLDPSTLTRGEQLTRYQAWSSAIAAGWLGADEVRAAENLPPREIVPPRPEPAALPVQEGTVPNA